MCDPRTLALLVGPASAGDSPFLNIVPIVLVFVIFYFVLILPMRNKQKKLEDVVRVLKAGDRIILNPGIFGTVVSVEDDTLQVRIDDKTRIKVLKSAVAGLQTQPPETEK